MSLQLKDMAKPRNKAPRIEEGTYISRIANIVDMGIQPQTDWQTGEETESKPRVLITYELPTERITITNEDGEELDLPRWISKEYTITSHDKGALLKLMKSVKPKSEVINLDELLDAACMVSVGSTINGNAKVVSVVQAPAGMEVPALENEAVAFDFDAPEEDVFTAIPKWVQEKIMDAENYSGFADEWSS